MIAIVLCFAVSILVVALFWLHLLDALPLPAWVTTDLHLRLRLPRVVRWFAFRELPAGAALPRGWGVAAHDFETGRTLAALVPLNLAIQFYRIAWAWLAWRCWPSRIDRAFRDGYRYGRQALDVDQDTALRRAREQGRQQALAEIEVGIRSQRTAALEQLAARGNVMARLELDRERRAQAVPAPPTAEDETARRALLSGADVRAGG